MWTNEDREDEARWEAEDEARREAQWQEHQNHTFPGEADPDCDLCADAAEEDE